MLHRLYNRTRNVFFQVVLAVFIAVVLILIIEFCVRAIKGSGGPPNAFIGLPVEELVTSEAYRSYEWTQDFLDELERNPPPTIEYAPFRLWKRASYHNKYMNYDQEGFRTSVSARTHNCVDPLVIYFFGGSTMEGIPFLRDEDTVPSLFSLQISLADPTACIKVQNFGVSGYNHENEVVLLRQLLAAGARPDVVILYNGANDVWHRVLSGNPHMAYGTFSRITSIWKGSWILPSFFETAINKLLRKSALVNLIAPQAPESSNPLITIPQDVIATRAMNAVQLYCGNVNLVNALGREYGFQPLVVLQPVLYLKDQTSDEETRLLRKANSKHPSLENAFQTTYSNLLARFADNSAWK